MRILAVDDHALVREGLRLVLCRLGDVVVDEASNLECTLASLTARPPDLVLLDYYLPDAEGMQALRQVRAAAPGASVVILTGDTDFGLARELIRAGARGFIPKAASPEVMIAALRLVLSGGIYVPAEMAPYGDVSPGGPSLLTDRQRQVLAMLADGHPNRAIARALSVSEPTVRAHVTAIFRALDVENRTQAAKKAMRLGLASKR